MCITVPPKIRVTHQLIGAWEGEELTLECDSEAYPKSINYWSRGDGQERSK